MTTSIEPIQGKVAKILNSREVALNIGGDAGVKSGMIFEIRMPREDVVKDPDTGDVLGVVNLPKTSVKINRVAPKFSVAATYRSKRVDLGGVSRLQPPEWETRYETLKKEGSFETGAEPLEAWDSYVDVGDPAVQVSVGNRTPLGVLGNLVFGQG